MSLYPCSFYGDLTSGVANCLDAQRRCVGCPEYRTPLPDPPPEPGPPQGFPVRFDENNLAIGQPGKRFNSSIIAWAGGYLLAYRDGWRGSEIHVVRLGLDFRPFGSARKLDLHCEAANYGREDPRLFLHRDRLHVAYVGVVGRWGPTNVLYARLGDDLAVEEKWHPALPSRRAWEKNWSFLSAGDDLYAVYTITPHSVIRIVGAQATTAHTTDWSPGWVGGEMRGGASPVRVGDEYWSFFHDRVEPAGHKVRYRMGLYTFDARPPFAPRRIIRGPVAEADATTNTDNYADVLFPCGAVWAGDDWVISMGIHDRWTELRRYSHADFESRLASVPV